MDFISIIVVIVAVFLGFFIQTVIGFAGSLISFPILLFKYDLQEATAIMSIPYILFSVVLVIKNWKDIDKEIVKKMIVGIVIGMVIGVSILKFGNPLILKKILGIVVIAYIIYTVVKKKKISMSDSAGYVFGLLGGVLGGLFSIGGPLLVMYIYNKVEKANVLRATIIGCLAVICFIRIPLLVVTNLYSYKIIILSLIVLPFLALSLYVGHLALKKINADIFKKIFIVMLFLAAVSLILR